MKYVERDKLLHLGVRRERKRNNLTSVDEYFVPNDESDSRRRKRQTGFRYEYFRTTLVVILLGCTLYCTVEQLFVSVNIDYRHQDNIEASITDSYPDAQNSINVESTSSNSEKKRFNDNGI